ncbi:MAG: hypothetical protein J5673_02560 [Candidatus Methanomethylophilaceae archaeon]|nr:hypothetical protein [Candidatus Methanomethylophilaceae archaeon]
MVDEYSPMDDIGLRNERFLISACEGVFVAGNYMRGLCGRFIRNGEALYDTISRYESISSFLLQRNNTSLGNRIRMLIPFLKAGGVTDHDAYVFAQENLRPMPGAVQALGYMSALFPTYLTTDATEHQCMTISDNLGIPPERVEGSTVGFDSFEIDRKEAKDLREIGDRISKIKLDREPLATEFDNDISETDTNLFYEMEEIFNDTIPKMKIFDEAAKLSTFGPNEKSYSLLNKRHALQIDFEDIAYVGNDIQDTLCMELIKDSDGLSISFNGDNHAVKEANVAVIGDDPIAVAVLTAEFYDYGIDAVFDLVENWNKEYLSSHQCSDRNLMDALLAQSKRRLPVVRMVTRDNMKEISNDSLAYRKKLEDRFRNY